MSTTQGIQIDLDRLVRLVLDDLGDDSPSFANEKSVAPVNDRTEKIAPQPSTSCPITVKPQTESTDLRLTEKVISVSVVHEYESHPSKRWILPPGAFLTPAAKDELRGRNIELVRSTSAAPVCAAVPANTGTNGLPTRVPVVNNEVQTSGSSFVLALHAVEKEQLLPTYVSWVEEVLHPRQIRKNCIIETTNELSAIFAMEQNAKGLIVTQYPALAVVLANRNRLFRCCVAKDMRQLQADAALLGANLLVVNPKETPVFLLRQMTKWFVDATLTEPDFLTRALR